MTVESLSAHLGTLERRTPSFMVDEDSGVAEPDVLTDTYTFPCRLSWGSGSEGVAASDMRAQTRRAKIFVAWGPPLSDPHSVTRGDRITVEEFPDDVFEVVFQRLIFAFGYPHHWEIDVETVQGN